MNKYLKTLILLSAMVLTSCLKFSGNDTGEAAPASAPASSIPSEPTAVVHNFNPLVTISLSSFVRDYPGMEAIYVGVPGITGVHMSGDEARARGKVTLGARGTAEYYTVVIKTSSGVYQRKVRR